MSSDPFTNCNSLRDTAQAKSESFHRRLQQLYPCVDDVSKLPQAWSTEAKAHSMGLTLDNLGCYFGGNCRREDDEKQHAVAIRTDHCIPPSCLLYYFEITFVSKGREGLMGVGLSSSQVSLNKLPGWAKESYGYHADDGNIFTVDGKGLNFGPTFTTDDVIGCGYNLVEGKCFFTKNGQNLGKAFEDIPSNILLYPTIGFKTLGEEIKANFGQEDFRYDIDQDLRSLRKNMTLTISNYPITDFSNWQNTLHKLVQSWLVQNSYPETADAFTRSTKLDCKENIQRLQQRNRIQQLVLNGRISEAIRLTESLCPSLLQNNPNLLFALKCRQFIELISGAESDYQPSSHYASSDNASNGLQRVEANCDQLDSSNLNVKANNISNNGCNGNLASTNGERINNQQSTSSSSSLQELMDVDQPLTSSISISTDNNHRNSLISNNNHSSQQQINNKMDTNGVDRLKVVTTGGEIEDNEQKLVRLLQFGRELNEHFQQLDKLYGKNEINEKMLLDAIGLIAFTNPQKSSFGKILDPSEREPISQLLNSSIVKAEMGESYRPPLEEVMNHLRKLVRLNDSHGKWLIDGLY